MFEDGSTFQYAYRMEVDVTRTITLTNTGLEIWLFQFTAEKSGLYMLNFDFDFFTAYDMQCVELIDPRNNVIQPTYYMTEQSNGLSGFYAEAGKTMYFYAYLIDDIYNEDYSEIIGVKDIYVPLEFTVNFVTEYTGEIWW